ncbi:MAG TPA: hypothetical protein VGS08_03410 [Candidatus Saccharimonadales bacterium]|nr:hypothetical protein [Candidatus Saccharimonadales bacterium]
MAYSLIQSTNNATGASPVTATYTSTPTQGNLILASVWNNTNSSALTSMQDGNSNNLTLLNSEARSTNQILFLYGMIATASQSKTITATLSGATIYMQIYEFSGNATTIANIIDNTVGHAENNGTVTTNNGSQPSVTTSNDNDLLFVQIGLGNTVTIGANPWTTSGGATVNLLQSNASGAIHVFDGYAIETTIGVMNPYATWTTGRAWAQLTTALLPAAIASSGTTRSLMGIG